METPSQQRYINPAQLTGWELSQRRAGEPQDLLCPATPPQASWIFPGQQEDVGMLQPRRYRVRVRVGEDDEGECE